MKIHNFVEHDGDGYIVMEYVDGHSLRTSQAGGRRRATPDPLPVDQALAYRLEILPALGHLHDRGLLFCDFKPDNVIHAGEAVKLIDLGGVYRMDDATSPVYGTPGTRPRRSQSTGRRDVRPLHGRTNARGALQDFVDTSRLSRTNFAAAWRIGSAVRSTRLP